MTWELERLFSTFPVYWLSKSIITNNLQVSKYIMKINSDIMKILNDCVCL